MPAVSQQSSERSAPVSVSPKGRSQLCQMSWGLPLRVDRDFDGLVDELQVLAFPALSGLSAPVVSQRLVCSTRDLVRELHLLSLRSVLLTRASKMRLSAPRAPLGMVHIVGRVRHLVRLRRHLGLASSTLPAVGIAQLACSWLCCFTRCGSALSRCGCYFHPLWVRSSHSLDHPSGRSGPQPLSSGLLSRGRLGHVF